MSEEPMVSGTNLNALRGGEVFTAPQLNQHLVIRTREDTIVNAGRVTYGRLHDETGRSFIVATDKMPKGSMVFVMLAKEIPD